MKTREEVLAALRLLRDDLMTRYFVKKNRSIRIGIPG